MGEMGVEMQEVQVCISRVGPKTKTFVRTLIVNINTLNVTDVG